MHTHTQPNHHHDHDHGQRRRRPYRRTWLVTIAWIFLILITTTFFASEFHYNRHTNETMFRNYDFNAQIVSMMQRSVGLTNNMLLRLNLIDETSQVQFSPKLLSKIHNFSPSRIISPIFNKITIPTTISNYLEHTTRNFNPSLFLKPLKEFFYVERSHYIDWYTNQLTSINKNTSTVEDHNNNNTYTSLLEYYLSLITPCQYLPVCKCRQQTLNRANTINNIHQIDNTTKSDPVVQQLNDTDTIRDTTHITNNNNNTKNSSTHANPTTKSTSSKQAHVPQQTQSDKTTAHNQYADENHHDLSLWEWICSIFFPTGLDGLCSPPPSHKLHHKHQSKHVKQEQKGTRENLQGKVNATKKQPDIVVSSTPTTQSNVDNISNASNYTTTTKNIANRAADPRVTPAEHIETSTLSPVNHNHHPYSVQVRKILHMCTRTLFKTLRYICDVCNMIYTKVLTQHNYLLISVPFYKTIITTFVDLSQTYIEYSNHYILLNVIFPSFWVFLWQIYTKELISLFIFNKSPYFGFSIGLAIGILIGTFNIILHRRRRCRGYGRDGKKHMSKNDQIDYDDNTISVPNNISGVENLDQNWLYKKDNTAIVQKINDEGNNNSEKNMSFSPLKITSPESTSPVFIVDPNHPYNSSNNEITNNDDDDDETNDNVHDHNTNNNNTQSDISTLSPRDPDYECTPTPKLSPTVVTTPPINETFVKQASPSTQQQQEQSIKTHKNSSVGLQQQVLQHEGYQLQQEHQQDQQFHTIPNNMNYISLISPVWASDEHSGVNHDSDTIIDQNYQNRLDISRRNIQQSVKKSQQKLKLMNLSTKKHHNNNNNNSNYINSANDGYQDVGEYTLDDDY